MSEMELPHTDGCLVCGRANPHGLRLSLHVDPVSGRVSTRFTPQAEHIGFEGIVHGGVLATVLDEAMVWAATWKGRRFCVCGELVTRFRHSAQVGQPLRIDAEVEFWRPRLVQTVAKVFDDLGRLIATGSGKYVPMPAEHHAAVVKTFVPEPNTAQAAQMLKAST
jgi:acyl-coenzyme A thioesterase PaaI-like protein